MRGFHRRAMLILWGLGGILLVVIVLLGKVRMPPAALLVLALLLLVLPFVVGVGLGLCYHAAWRSWLAWAATLFAAAMAGALSRQPVQIGPFDLQGAATLLLIGVGAALMTAIGITLFRYDIALATMAWMSLGLMWGAVFWWRLGGDFVVATLNALRSASTTTSPIYWPSLILTVALCLSPLILASFFWHTARLIMRERQRVPLPVTDEQVA